MLTETLPTAAPSTCRSRTCGARIRWVVTEAGKRMPLDYDPSPDGNVIAVEVKGERRARVLGSPSDVPEGTQAWRSHFASCVEPQVYRKHKGKVATP